MRRILITGGTGFVGTYLAALLKRSEVAIFSMSSAATPSQDSAVTALKVDIRDREEVLQAVADVSPNEIYHLAAVSAVGASWSDPRDAFEVNVLGSYNIFEAVMKMTFPPRILNVSTSQVYARSESPLKETDRVSPDNPYAATKAMAELLTVQYTRSSSGGITTVRPFNHTGPGQLPIFVLSSIAKQFAEIKLGVRPPVLALGNIDAKRDFTDVRDVVRAYKMVIDSGIPGEVYNVCSGTAVGLREVVDLFRKSTGIRAEL